MNLKKAMILAAGFGKRMLPITTKIPKPLVQIGKTTLLENCIQKLKDFGTNLSTKLLLLLTTRGKAPTLQRKII